MAFYSMLPFNNNLIKKFLPWKQGDEEDNWRVKATEALVKKLKKNDPDSYHCLELALTKKSDMTPCVPLPRSQDGRLQVSHRKMLPQVMYCRIFRWPDLQNHNELKSIARCKYPADRTADRTSDRGHERANDKPPMICINPYHYSRVEHSLYPPVVSPRTDSGFINVSPPPQSPLSPYSQQPGSPPNYLQQMPQPAHEHNNQYHPIPAHTTYKHEGATFDQSAQFNTMNGQQNFRPQQGGFSCSNQSPCSENYFGAVNSGNEAQPSQSLDSQTPPPQYGGRSTNHQLALMPMDYAEDGRHSSLNSNQQMEGWCRIQYFELNQKVGEQFKTNSPKVFVDGFTDPSIHNHRFSLGVISNINRNSTIEMTRRAIRKGICLEYLDDHQIFVMNLSDVSIFFQSKNCNLENQLNKNAVVKIEPNRRQKIFDQKIFEGIVQEARNAPDAYERLYHLADHCSIKMSFVKGWGSIYQRQDVTSTPCWIEILLTKAHAFLDTHLQETQPNNLKITSTS